MGFTSPTWKGYPAVNIDGLQSRIVGVIGNMVFGTVTVGSSPTAMMTISNSGNSTLTVNSIAYPSGFSGNWHGGVIAANSSQNVTVTFSPTAVQVYSGTITVNTNSTAGTGTTQASGQGIAAPAPHTIWQTDAFTATDIATGFTTMTADFENDGLANLLEYAFVTDPKAANASPLAVSFSGNNLQISFPCNSACTDITYTVQASSTLNPSSWADIARSIGGAATVPVGSHSTVSDPGTGFRTVTVTDSTAIPTGDKKFLRVKVTVP
ncbi:MAG: choice-of-anchor D domain-containing protein [Terrimicrobiaceae bacterium]